ncbi:MAG: hypothetical protein LBJ19_01345 [Holosporaceae bacterium]|nr:hypothetical protein [Holosporaceae bacterium]
MRVWTAVDRNRLRFARFEVGDASSETLRRFWAKITETNEVKMVCTDGNPSYAEVFEEDADLKHFITKSETCLVESYNSVLRYYLARLHRKTKCYSKSKKMLMLSIKLLAYEKFNLY